MLCTKQLALKAKNRMEAIKKWNKQRCQDNGRNAVIYFYFTHDFNFFNGN